MHRNQNPLRPIPPPRVEAAKCPADAKGRCSATSNAAATVAMAKKNMHSTFTLGMNTSLTDLRCTRFSCPRKKHAATLRRTKSPWAVKRGQMIDRSSPKGGVSGRSTAETDAPIGKCLQCKNALSGVFYGTSRGMTAYIHIHHFFSAVSIWSARYSRSLPSGSRVPRYVSPQLFGSYT